VGSAFRRPAVDARSELPPGFWAYLRACDVSRLSDDVLNVTLDHAQRIESSRSTVTIWQQWASDPPGSRRQPSHETGSVEHKSRSEGGPTGIGAFESLRARHLLVSHNMLRSWR
jgi:hypothetical protein